MARKGRLPGRGEKIDRDRRDKSTLIQSSLDLLYGGEHKFKIPDVKDREGWYQWTLEHLPIPIPKHRVCKDHDTPLDFFIKFVTGTFDHYINVVFCSRESFKTYLLANASAVKAILFPGCEIMGMGGIEEQAKQGWRYFNKFVNNFVYIKDYIDPDKDILALL